MYNLPFLTGVSNVSTSGEVANETGGESTGDSDIIGDGVFGAVEDVVGDVEVEELVETVDIIIETGEENNEEASV